MMGEGERWPGLRRVFRLPGSRRRAGRDVDAEMRFHLEERIEELTASGLTRADAARRARDYFGDVEHWRRLTRRIDQEMTMERRRMEYLDAFRRETRLSVRALVRSPGFAIATVLTLALGAGATTAIFTLLDRIVLRPLPYSESEQLVSISHPVQGPGMPEGKEWGLSSAGYFHFRRESRTLSDLGVYMTFNSNVIAGGRAERTQTAAVSATLLSTLRIRPVLGRLIDARDDAPGLPGVAMIGYDTWMQRFGGDSSVIGKILELEGQQLEVIGVTARDANVPTVSVFSSAPGGQRFKAELWIPLNLDPTRAINSHPYTAVGRMRPGFGVDDVERELAPIIRRFPELFPQAYSPAFMQQYQFGLAVRPERDRVIGAAGKVLWLSLGAAGLVFVIAWANVANLFLVRIEARRRETSVRVALGAERVHLAFHFLSESMLVTMVAGLVGCAFAWLALRVLIATAPPEIPRLDEVTLDWRAITFALGVSLLAGFVFGALPTTTGTGVTDFLREGARGMTLAKGRRTIRSALVVAQIALAVVLLASAGLLVRSVTRLRGVRPGFEAGGVLAIDVAIPRRVNEEYANYVGVAALHRELIERVAALPGVTGVGVGTGLPLAGFVGCALVFARDRWPIAPGEEPPCVPHAMVSPGYFRALGIAVRGREPTWGDIARQNGSIVVTREFARRMWPNEDPIGKMVNPNGGPSKPYYTIVGVVEGLRANSLDRPPTEAVFYPIVPMKGSGLWDPPRSATLIIRGSIERPTQLVTAIRGVVTAIDPAIAVANVRSMEDVVAASMGRVSFIMRLLALGAAMAVLLSAIGIYGVISFVVAQRRAEIGLRIALGARVSQVRRMVMRQSVQLAVVGVVFGVLGALAVTRVLAAMLFEVSPTDPFTLGAVALLLVSIAAVAGYAPARRASRVDPVEALRGD